MAAKHYSDPELLGLLDGECSPLDMARIWLHLRRCWACRGRMAELESTAQRFALALQRDDYPGRDRVDRAKQRFLDAVNVGVAHNDQPAPAIPNLFARQRTAWLVPAFGAGLVLAATGTVGYFVIRGTSTSPPLTNARPKSTDAVVLPPPIQTQPLAVVARAPQGKPPTVSVPSEIASPAQLEAAELEARYALHRASLDLSVVEYLREPGVLTIRGFSPDQAEALSFLGARSYVHLRFEAPAAPEGTIVSVDTHPAVERAPIEARLESWFAKQSYPSPEDRNRAYAAYLNEVVSLATKAQRAATRLQRLAVRYQGAPLTQFPAEHRWLLEAMIRDHLGVLDVVTDRERLLLDQVFPELAPIKEVRPLGSAVWSDACLEVSREASASQGSIIELFTSRDAGDRDAGEAIPLIQQQLNQWPSLRTQTETVLSRQFQATQEKP